MTKHYSFAILGILLCISAVAQPLLKRDDYRRQVLDYSNQIKMGMENSSAALDRFKMIRTGFYPSVSLAANGSYQKWNDISFGQLTMKNYNYNSTLSIQQTVYGGGAVRANSNAAQIEYGIAQVNEELTIQNVLYASDLTYWAFAASTEQLQIAKDYVEIVKNLYDIVQIRFNDGYISRTDLLMVQTRLNEAELQMISATQLYKNSLINLSRLIGKDNAQEYVPGDTISLIPSIDKVMANGRDVSMRPEYRIAEGQVDLQMQNLKVARSRYNPQLVVGVQGVYGTPSLNFTGDPKLYGVGFVSLSVPLFMWGERRHNTSMVRAGIRSSEYSLRETHDNVNAELKQAVVNLQEVLKQVEVAERNLEASSLNLELNTFSYGEGRLPIVDVLQSQLAWIQAYTAFVNTNYSYRTAIASYYKSAAVDIKNWH